MSLGHSAISETPLSALPDAGGTSVSVTPGIDTLVLTGFAPTVTATSNATVTPAIDTLVLTGLAPTVTATQSQTVTPANDTLVITGYAPTVTVPNDATVTPGVGALVITGYAPTVSSGADVYIIDGHDGHPRSDERWKREKLAREELRTVIANAMEQVLGVPVRPVAPIPDQPVAVVTVPQTIDRDTRKQIIAALEASVPKQELPDISTIKATIRSLHQDVLKRQAEQAKSDEEDDLLLLVAA